MLSYFIIFVIIALFLFKVFVKFTTGRDHSSTCLIGKTAIVTGANSGIGFYTALDFAKRGARVILACRNKEEAEKARDEIIKQSDNKNVVFKYIDFSSLKSVQDFAIDINKTEEKLDILVNNAGVSMIGRNVTENGFDKVMQINYFGSFLLTMLLLDKLKQSAPSRIVNVASMVASGAKIDPNNIIQFLTGSMPGLREHQLYNNSKLGNILFTVALADKLKGTNVTVNCLHPGVIRTNILREAPKIMKILVNFILEYFMKNGEEGAQTTIYLAVSKEVANVSGCYFADCKQQKHLGKVNSQLAQEVWHKTVELLNEAKFKINC